MNPPVTEEEYQSMLACIEVLMKRDPDKHSITGTLLDTLVMVVHAYEVVHYPFDAEYTKRWIEKRALQSMRGRIDDGGAGHA